MPLIQPHTVETVDRSIDKAVDGLTSRWPDIPAFAEYFRNEMDGLLKISPTISRGDTEQISHTPFAKLVVSTAAENTMKELSRIGAYVQEAPENYHLHNFGLTTPQRKFAVAQHEPSMQ